MNKQIFIIKQIKFIKMKDLFTIQNESKSKISSDNYYLTSIFNFNDIILDEIYNHYIKYQKKDVTYNEFLDDLSILVRDMKHDYALYEEKYIADKLPEKKCMKEKTYINKYIFQAIDTRYN